MNFRHVAYLKALIFVSWGNILLIMLFCFVFAISKELSQGVVLQQQESFLPAVLALSYKENSFFA